MHRDEYADYRETSIGERLTELGRVHAAADCAEYAGREDFIEQVIPELTKFTVIELWALSAILRDRADRWLAKFVAYYARKAEAAEALAVVHREPRADYRPSPILLWGEWRAQQGRRDGCSACQEWADKQKAIGTPQPGKVVSLANFLRDWTPIKPS